MTESDAKALESAVHDVTVPPRTTDSQVMDGDFNYRALAPIYDRKKIESLLKFKNKSTDLKSNSLHNVLAFLRHDEKFHGLFRWDRFARAPILHREPFWQGSEPFKVRKRQDTDIFYIESEMDKLDINSPAQVRKGVDMVARENWINPPLEYFETIKWDGKERLPTWLQYYLGADGDPEYLAAVGMAWLIAGVARIYKPGSKAENMLVLEGVQGLKKSTALKVLATIGSGSDEESYFCDTLSFAKMYEKDSIMILHSGKLIVEFQELAKLGSREIEEVKAWMSIEEDMIRLPYGHDVEMYKRQFIMAATTNESCYLKDDTGNRRFWPVKCTAIDIPSLIADREQLWAEAVWRYKNKTTWWIENSSPVFERAQLEQDLRYIEDLWTQPIENYVEWKQFVTIPEILLHFKIEIADQNKGHESRVAGVLRRLGFKKRKKRVGRKDTRGWERTTSTQEVIEPEFEEELKF